MLTRSKLPQLHEDHLDEVTLVTTGPRPPLSRWLTERRVVTGRWPVGLGLAWLAVYGAAIVVEPAPAHPDAAVPVWATLMFFALFAGLGTMAGGLARRQRLGLVASVFAGGLALLGAVMCPVSNHHEAIGAWWYLEIVGFTGLVGASLVGLRRSRSPQSA